MVNGSFNFVTFLLLLATGIAAALTGVHIQSPTLTVAIIVVGVYVSLSPRQVTEWNRGVLLRLGKFQRVLQPGISWVVPGLDSIVSMVDMRIRSTSFSAESTLTHDTVPVNVDAVMFWVVTDAQRAILEVARFLDTVSWAAQTTLRDVIGTTRSSTRSRTSTSSSRTPRRRWSSAAATSS